VQVETVLLIIGQNLDGGVWTVAEACENQAAEHKILGKEKLLR